MILRPIGLASLEASGEELRAYYDPHYVCRMEVLQFDSRCPAAKYESWVRQLTSELPGAQVICRERARPAIEPIWSRIEFAPEPVVAAGWQPRYRPRTSRQPCATGPTPSAPRM
jgi:hypothetical protein